MNHFSGRRRAVLVLTGYVKEERARQVTRFIQRIFDPNTVVTNCGVRAMADCQQVRQFSAKAKADCAYRPFTCWVPAKRRHRGSSILDGSVLIEPPVQCERPLPVSFAVSVDLDARFLPPE